jgi:hypothetical protein
MTAPRYSCGMAEAGHVPVSGWSPLKHLLPLVLTASLVSCVIARREGRSISLPPDPAKVEVVGQFSIAPLGRFPPGIGLRFGGVSSLATVPGSHDLIGVSDDHSGSRAYRFSVSGSDASFQVTPTDVIALERPSDGEPLVDPEGLFVTRDGHLIVSCEGLGLREPRVPPSIVEFGVHGEYVQRLAVPDRFVPNPTGPQTKGVRSNSGFEALTLTPDGSRLFTASENALVQDGDVTTLEHGTMTRLLEYRRHKDTYVPHKEFMYPMDPVFKPPFEVGLAVHGLVELIALGGSRLLAMERTYVAETGGTGRGVNKIRLFRIDLAGASDVSTVESLKDVTGLVPVAKTPFLDLSDLAGLSPDLASTLDNFEGMTFGPPLPDGRPSLVLVSDDNFNPKQRTWFLMLGIGR